MNKIYRMLEQGWRSRNESAAWHLIYILYILLILSCLASGLRCLRPVAGNFRLRCEICNLRTPDLRSIRFLLFNLNSKPQTRNPKLQTKPQRADAHLNI
jgi:hypothetical protein